MSRLLREIVNTMQVRGEPRRRWFAAEAFDLIVWHDPSGEVIGFQLCYGKPASEKALTWRAAERRMTHMAVDDGEGRGGTYKSTPILKPGGNWDATKLLEDFLAAADLLPVELKTLVAREIALANEKGLS